MRAAERVRATYTAADVMITGAWTAPAPAPDGGTFVLLDVQSALPGIVQARLDLWYAGDTSAMPVGRSDVLSAAAEVGAFAFEDLTGDGLPDLLGYVADSSDTRYPVFIPGAVGQMGDELEVVAPGWRFDVEGDSLPTAPPLSPPPAASRGRACYLRLWALDPAPDRRGEGWRYLTVLPGGRLSPPAASPPHCAPG